MSNPCNKSIACFFQPEAEHRIENNDLKFKREGCILKCMGKWIAIVEDEPDVSHLISYHLQKNGFKTREFRSAEPLLEILPFDVPSLVILDLMLPDIDGLEVCKKIKSDERTSRIPIIIVTAKDEETDKIVGLELGADDYITKPFSPNELVARVKAVLRRVIPSEPPDKVIKVGKNLVIDTEAYSVFVNGKKVELTTSEFKLLKILAEKKGKVFARDKLLDLVWGIDKAVIDRTIDVHIKNLREKLGKAGKMIKTIRGIGYKIEEE
jgi:two-component system phosphate regulon response regulator PhoB/two-component system alkaline phosphatase synthesis response regulator PhoP